MKKLMTLTFALLLLCACALAQDTATARAGIAVAAPKDAAHMVSMVDKPDGGADKEPVVSLDVLTPDDFLYMPGVIPFL